jgi:hypothetical protein
VAPDDSQIRGLAQRLADAYADCSAVDAVALAGSRSAALGADAGSDIDLYVYSRAALPLDVRRRIANQHAGTALEIGNAFWENGDEWVAATPATKIDVMMRDVAWTEDEIARVVDRHEARLGYSTCILHNVKNSTCLFDRTGWYARTQARAAGPFSVVLRDAILAKNHPVLRNAHSGYVGQIRSAAARDDRVSVNHRVAALLASAFDIIFAVNCLPHPGEKRLLRWVEERCSVAPEKLTEDVSALIDSVGEPGAAVVARAEQVVDRIDGWLESLGLLPPWPPRP